MAFIDDFAGVPLGLLISQPIIEVAKGQAELCNVYLDQLFKLAFTSMPNFEEEKPLEAKVVKFNLNRPIVNTETGDLKYINVEIEAPLLALVPIPAFTMEEATVQFTMEVKESVTQKIEKTAQAGFQSSFSAWGFKTSVSGSVSTTRENTRTSDKSAKYDIFARATQQPAAEGMAKLSSIFASVIEPVTVGESS